MLPPSWTGYQAPLVPHHNKDHNNHHNKDHNKDHNNHHNKESHDIWYTSQLFTFVEFIK